MIRLKDILKEITISDPTDTLVPGRSYKVGYGLKPLQYMGRTNKGHTFYRPDGSAEYRSDSQVELGLKNGVIRLMLPGERLDEISIGFGYDELINSFPGHARQKNPVDSPQYQWYVKAVDFVQSTNNIHQAAEVVKFFQNDFLGMDYDDRDSDEEIVKWWLSKEEQDWIRDELNIGNKYSHSYGGVKKYMRNEITISNPLEHPSDLKVGTKYDIRDDDDKWQTLMYDGQDYGNQHIFVDDNIYDGGNKGIISWDRGELQWYLDHNDIRISHTND
jgi:hypothetical protein